MEDKTRVGLIVTIATTLLCGCPGLCIFFSGAIFAISGGTYTTDLPGYYDSGAAPPAVGYTALCIGFLMVLLPIGAGIFTFITNRKEKAEVVDLDEPVPPAI